MKKLVGSYERKLKYHPKEITKQDVSAIKKLEQLTKSKEENFINIEDLKKNTSLSSKNSDKKTKDTISELKALANKVNKWIKLLTLLGIFINQKDLFLIKV